MDCEKLTKLIQDITSRSDAVWSSNPSIALPARGEIEKNLSELPSFGAKFLEWVSQSVFNLNNIASERNEIAGEMLINNYFQDRELSARDYRQFLVRLVKFCQSPRRPNAMIALPWVNSLFLRVFAQGAEPFSIDLKGSPAEPAENFGLFFGGGNIRIKEISGEAFSGMTNGRVEIDSYLWQKEAKLADHMSGGQIVAHDVEANVASRMKGGTIVIDNLKSHSLGHLAEGGTVYVKNFEYGGDSFSQSHEMKQTAICPAAEGGTFFVENIQTNQPCFISGRKGLVLMYKGKPNRVNISKNFLDVKVFCYDESKDMFESVAENGFVLELNNSSDLQNFFMLKKGENRDVASVSLGDNFGYTDFSEMGEGILIVKELKINHLGEGMTGGIIIIDDPELSLEEARSRVSSRRDGGVILYLKKWTERNRFGLPRKRAEFVVL